MNIRSQEGDPQVLRKAIEEERSKKGREENIHRLFTVNEALGLVFLVRMPASRGSHSHPQKEHGDSSPRN